MATSTHSRGPLQTHPGARARGNPNPLGQPLSSQPNSGARPAAQNLGQQNSSCPQASTRDPQPRATPLTHSHPHVPPPPRPYIYIHPTPFPPPPFHQWPMSFPYNPYCGLPNVGYGMVMPPYPSHPFMEPPGYFLPQPNYQLADYRRVVHPHYSAANVPYQTQNQYRRLIHRPNQSPSAPRETVNSEVQTDPVTRSPGYARGSPEADSDSGHGTNSPLPSTPGSTVGGQGGPERNETSPSKGPETNFQVAGRSEGTKPSKHNSTASPTRQSSVQSNDKTPLKLQNGCEGTVSRKNYVSCSQGSDGWSVCSTDGMVPVCSSPEREMIIKGRRESFPDILMSGGGAFPQVEMATGEVQEVPPSSEQLPSYNETIAENEKPINPILTERTGNEVDTGAHECEVLYKILKLPLNLHELLSQPRGANMSVWSVDSIPPYVPSSEQMTKNKLQDPLDSQRVPDNQPDENKTISQLDNVPHYERNAYESLSHEEIALNNISFDHLRSKRGLNGSTGSVESMASYICSKEWLIRNGVLEPDVISDLAVEGDLTFQNANPTFPEDNGVPDNELDEGECLLHEETIHDVASHDLHFQCVKAMKKLNESVWSVESLGSCIPSKEWLIKNGILMPDIVIEEVVDGNVNNRNGQLTQNRENTKVSKERRRSRRFSLCGESVPMYIPTASCITLQCSALPTELSLNSKQDENVVFSTPYKMPSPNKSKVESEIVSSKQKGTNLRQDLSLDTEKNEKDPLASLTPHRGERNANMSGTEGEKDGNENGSSEHDSNITEQLERNVSSPKHIAISSHMEDVKIPSTGQQTTCYQEVKLKQEMAQHGLKGGSGAASHPRSEQPGAHTVDEEMTTVSLFKGSLVDCGIQCSDLEMNCVCKRLMCNRSNGKSPGKTGDKDNGSKMEPEIFADQDQQGGLQKRQTDFRRTYKTRPGEEVSENGCIQRNHKKHGQWKNRPQNRQQTRNTQHIKPFTRHTGLGASQEEAFSGHYNRLGKQMGGNGRNQRS